MLRALVTLSFSGLLLGTTTVCAGTTPADIDALFKQAVSSDTVPGITVAVGDASGVIYAKGFGFADVENQVAMTPSHKVRIGSVSKLVATAGLMRLYDQDKVNLDAPVSRYAPAWPADKPTMTLRQLTSHTAGIRHYKEGANEFLLNEHYASINAALALFKDDPLLYAPGTDHRYSTFAWTLVSAAMEGADQQRNFRQLIEQEVFTPLSLTNMVFDDQYAIIAHRARPYSVKDGTLQNSPQTDHSYKWAGGGFIATPSDVVNFALAHVNSDYLQANTVQHMFTPAQLNDGTEVPFGIGWMVGFDGYKKRDKYKNDADALALMDEIPNAVMHSGGSMGGITMLIMCPEHKRAVTVVKNVDGDESADVFMLTLKTLVAYHQAE